MLEESKKQKIKSFENDDSDLTLVFDEYIEREVPFSKENVFVSFDEIKQSLKNECFYIIFGNQEFESDNVYTVKRIITDKSTLEDDLYYSGKKYFEKIENLSIESELLEKIRRYEEVSFIFDMKCISTVPLWETKIHRKIKKVLQDINNLEDENLTPNQLSKIIRSKELIKISNFNLYDIDLIIKYVIEISKIKPVSVHFISKAEERTEKFLIEELRKLIFAANISGQERNEYIYNTTYKYMNEMFSRFNFCNFKKNMCLSQRHKGLFNRYPTPKTDGCCFKVVRKCKHNNKDGTCKVECLACKLFTCPYLSKLGVGLRISELILIRAFMNSKQKRLLIYKFYKPKEFFVKRMS